MTFRPLRMILIGLIVLLAGGLLWQELSGPPELPQAPPRQSDWSLPALRPLAMPPESEFESVLQRPLFNPDRKPVEIADNGLQNGSQGGDGVNNTPPQPLEVVLRGVILLPEHRIALLEDSKGKHSMRVREGEPLKGDLSEWKLEKIHPRSARFVQTRTGREEEVKLQVYGKPLPATQGGKTAKNPSGKKTGETGSKSEKKKTASGLDPEEIRRKVAERRARLRAEAARKRAKNKSKQKQ